MNKEDEMRLTRKKIDEAVWYNASRGYTDSTWRHVQIAVGAVPTGVPEEDTAKAVAEWQVGQGLEMDGKVGPATLAAIGASPREGGELLLSNLVAWNPSRTYGIDVSDYQGRPDFSYVRNAGAKFVFVKLTEGRTWRSKVAEDNWPRAVDAGLVVAGYHLARLVDGGRESDVGGAVDNFVSFLDKVCGSHSWSMPHMLDLEFDQVKRHADVNGTRASLAWIERFVGDFTERTGAPCGLYLSARTMRLLGKNHGELPSLVTWVADYGKLDRVPAPWRMDVRQFTSSGVVPGIRGKVDLDYYEEGF